MIYILHQLTQLTLKLSRTECNLIQRSEVSLFLPRQKSGIVISGDHSNVDKAQFLYFDVENEVKCLVIWWTSDSSCRKSIDERMTKANGVLFASLDS